MLCNHCNKREATIRFQFNYMGQSGEIHLCERCAETLKQMSAAALANWPALMAQMAGWSAPAPGQEAPAAEIPAPPPAVDEDFRRRRRLGELRAKLNSAVALEQYEEAARLRDEIKRSEKEACTHES